MFERLYRRRLEADLARWQADGVITAEVGTSIRNSLPPIPSSINIAVVVAILGGLLIAAASLAFVAANWSEIARPLRFCILLVGIAGAHVVGTWFARNERPVLADLAVAVGTLIYGAAIALVGQMYHLGDDFAGAMLLWSGGAVAAAALTGSRGALAVALVTGLLWSGSRVFETYDVPHLPFVPIWIFAAVLALAWRSRIADHLVATAALVWWVTTDVGRLSAGQFDSSPLSVITAAGAGLMLGAGLTIAEARWETARNFASTLAVYGSFALAGAAAVASIASHSFRLAAETMPRWAIACAAIGVLLALLASAIARRPGPALAGLAGGLAAVAAAVFAQQTGSAEPWLAYALELIAMLCLVVSGMLDEVRPRVVAGWIGLAAVVAAITWGVKGSLLRRSVFLGAAGAAAIGLAFLLGRLLPSEGTKS